MTDCRSGHEHASATVGSDGMLALTGSTERVPWWSFTKTVLSIATLRLVEDGMVDLDEALQGQAFTARQLLRHEAGLPDYGGLPAYRRDVAAGRRPWPLDRLLAAVDADRLRYPPGAGWAYSNIGYLRIAELIERRTRLDLREALASLVFGPAGLHSTRLALEPADLADVQMGIAGAYHPGWVYHGLIVGTVADAARLMWSLISGRLLGNATFSSMIEPRPLPDYRSDRHPDPAYGIGLMLNATDPQLHPIGHSGEGPGSRISVYALEHKASAVWAAETSGIDADAEAFAMLHRKPRMTAVAE